MISWEFVNRWVMRFVHLRDSCLLRTSCLVPPDLSSFLPLLFVGCATWISRAGIDILIYSKAELIVVCFHMFSSSLCRFRIDRNASRSEQFLQVLFVLRHPFGLKISQLYTECDLAYTWHRVGFWNFWMIFIRYNRSSMISDQNGSTCT